MWQLQLVQKKHPRFLIQQKNEKKKKKKKKEASFRIEFLKSEVTWDQPLILFGLICNWYLKQGLLS